MTETRGLILKLLRNLGSRKEVEQYLKEFSSVESQKFAIVKVGGGILQTELDSLVSSLSFLQRVGLYPIVIHGAGPQLTATLNERGIETRREEGLRVTDAPTLEAAREVFLRENLRLVEALEVQGTRARPIPSGVFQAELVDPDRFGFVGRVSGLNLEPIRSSIRSGALPILASLGETQSGQIVNINADETARRLALKVEPHKIVFLTPTGGLLDHRDQLIPSVNLAEDFEFLMEQEWLHSGMRLKLQEIQELLSGLPLSSSVSITRPDQLARELFTHSGSGTLIRQGERIHLHERLDGLDLKRIQRLLESCFGRELVPGYFESKRFYRIYVTDNYRAIAILTLEDEVPYLDKFGVTRRAQGEGLGHSLWQRMWQDNPQLFWRSRSGNPINTWYFQQADGSYRSDPWTVFWYGIHNLDVAWRSVGRALSFPATLIAHSAEGAER